MLRTLGGLARACNIFDLFVAQVHEDAGRDVAISRRADDELDARKRAEEERVEKWKVGT